MKQSRVGTLHYFAPEIVETAKYNHTVDYWSAGIIAFELMTGRLPFIPHQTMFEIIVNIKKKSMNCIALTEDPNQDKSYQEHCKIFTESLMTLPFKEKIEKWLQSALNVNAKQRGMATDEVQQQQRMLEAQKLHKGVQFYSLLDKAINTKVLSIFCLTTCQFYGYEVTEEMKLTELLSKMEKDLNFDYRQFYLIFPTGHPRSKLSSEVRPIDWYVEEWADTSNSSNPPVMLYLHIANAEHDLGSQSHVSDIIKECIRNNNNNIKHWLHTIFQKHTQFMQQQGHHRLQAYIRGLQEFAFTLEQNITEENDKIEKTMITFYELSGMIKHFHDMISNVRTTNKLQLSEQNDFYNNWNQKSEKYMEKLKKLHGALMGTNTRYKSALRRIQNQAKSNYFEKMLKEDLIG